MDKIFTVIGARNIQGFFSNFLHTLQHLHTSEIKNTIPLVYWTGGIYARKEKEKENIWEYYFEQVSPYNVRSMNLKDPNVSVVSKYRAGSLSSEPNGIWDYELYPPNECLNNPSVEGRKFVHAIIDKYVRLKTHISDKINKFYNEQMKDSYIVGVHMRYCNDMRPAQGKDPLKRIIKYLKKKTQDRSNYKIFMATDYKPFLDAVESEFKGKVIYTSSIRSRDGNPVQYGLKPKKKKTPIGPVGGEQVIIDCYLLSKCNFLFHGISNVSSVALYLNPHLEKKFIPKYDEKLKKYLEIE